MPQGKAVSGHYQRGLQDKTPLIVPLELEAAPGSGVTISYLLSHTPMVSQQLFTPLLFPLCLTLVSEPGDNNFMNSYQAKVSLAGARSVL